MPLTQYEYKRLKALIERHVKAAEAAEMAGASGQDEAAELRQELELSKLRMESYMQKIKEK